MQTHYPFTSLVHAQNTNGQFLPTTVQAVTLLGLYDMIRRPPGADSATPAPLP